MTMTHKAASIGLSLIAFLLLVAWFSRDPASAQNKAGPAFQKWDYKIVLPDNVEDPRANQAQLDKLGTEGWELCVAHSSTRPNYYIFKRPKR
jgi:hypothetical protein